MKIILRLLTYVSATVALLLAGWYGLGLLDMVAVAWADSEHGDQAVVVSPWSMWTSGWFPVAILFVTYVGGRFALDERRWIAKRWPRIAAYLDRGKVWAALAAAISVAATLLPLAIMGDLSREAALAEFAAVAGIYMTPTRKPRPDQDPPT